MHKRPPMKNDSRRRFLAQSGALASVPWLQDAVRAEERARSNMPVGAKLGDVHVLPATSETTQWGWFDNAQRPGLKLRSGDCVAMETMMAAANQVLPGVTIEALTKMRLEHPGRGPHTITGPI